MNKKNKKGSVFIIFAFLLTAFVSFGGIAADIAYLFLVKTQLQTAADAAALHGAAQLYPLSDSGEPNWQEAQAEAQAAISLNKAQGQTLEDANITVGYWDLTQSSGELVQTSNPSENQIAAVMVKINKAPGENGGAVQTFFSKVFGLTEVSVGAKACGVVGSSSTVGENILFPTALPQSVYDQMWDSNTQQPKIDPSTGEPYVIQADIATDGGWSSFLEQNNSANYIKNLMTDGNPQTLKIGDSIWIASGNKTSLYKDVPSDVDMLIAITEDSTKGTYQKIIGFGAIHIDFGQHTGQNKYIQIHLITDYQIPNSTPGGGPTYGTYTYPRLAL